MRLSFGVTKIGRGQNNDFFLDSSKLKNFISRYHAEVIGTKNENGEVEFVLTDKGLNGTFINDYRTKKTCSLEIGDKITFGHTNGYKIQPGFFASQPESEFQFIFEQVPKSSRTAELSSDNFNREESTEAFHEQKKYSERSFLSDKNSNIQSPHITSTKDLQKDPDSENEENEDIKSTVITKTDTLPKGSSKTSTTKDKKSLDISQESVTKSVKENVTSALAETIPAIELDNDSDNDDDQAEDSEDNDMDKNDEVDDGGKDDDIDDDDGGLKDDDEGDDGIKDDDGDDVEDEADGVEKDNDVYDYVESAESEKESKPKKPVRKKRRVKSSFTKPRSKPKAKETKEDVMSFSDDNDSSEDDVQKQVSSVLALINTTSESDSGQQLQKEVPPKPPARGPRSRRKSGSSNTASTANKGRNIRKRKDSGQSKPVNAKRRRTRGQKDTGEDDKELSDGVEWYEEDTCEADVCKRPKNKRTPWVQCDDCDGWYHTVCVGANYRQVKDDNASFSCGCT